MNYILLIMTAKDLMYFCNNNNMVGEKNYNKSTHNSYYYRTILTIIIIN